MAMPLWKILNKNTVAWDPWWDFFCWQVFWKVLKGGDEGLATGFFGILCFFGSDFQRILPDGGECNLVCIVLLFVDVFLFSTCSILICCMGFHFLNFCEHFIATIHLYLVHFPGCWVCIVLLSVVLFSFFT
jgi:hypothetical protein